MIGERALPARVVAIGASAGGLAALCQLVAGLPAASGFAFVVLQHRAESQLGVLASELASRTTMPVSELDHDGVLEPDHLYLVAPHAHATITPELVLRCSPEEATRHFPIDALFSSLANALGARAVGVVLSGTATDGTEGLRAIKLAGGLTIAQEPESAEFDEMPRNAIAAGVVGVILPPDRIASELVALVAEPVPDETERGGMARILQLLRDQAGIDFTTYKRSTIERRLERQRARVHAESLDEYADYLVAHPREARELYEDLLIHVTEFFRDPELLAQAIAHALPEILEARHDASPVRIWVPGCSTGEEVYSLAMLVLDTLAERGDTRTIQMFGTDLSERAIDIARAARYPSTIAAQVGEARLARYFVPDGAGWRVRPSLRERCVFVRHDLTADPPFSRLDLVSCRNVLIYMSSAQQRAIMPVFHYALEQPGFLLLGASESAASFESMFVQAVPRIPLYRRRPLVARPGPLFALRAPVGSRRVEAQPISELYRSVDHLLLSRYAPACVIVDENFDVVQFRGRTGAFLEPAPGQPQLNVLRMAREGIAPELRRIAQRAQRDDVTVRSFDVAVGDGVERHVDLEVVPLRRAGGARHFLVVFADASVPVPPERKREIREGTADRVEQLEQELAATKEYLQSAISQHLATSEELGVLNEELQSTNEELQSSNEELQTAKEELQSTNDELDRLNQELTQTNGELRRLNDDLVNVLASVDLGIVILDTERRVRRFTPRARSVFNLLEADLGRPISDLQPKLELAGLDAAIERVTSTLEVHEREVRSEDGTTYRMQIRPYRTVDDRIGGAVLVFVDITALRRSLEEAHRAREAERTATEAMAREKDAFLNAVSHELRTPLSAILLWTAVLRPIAGQSADAARAVNTIEQCAIGEAQLVDDLLDLALSRGNAEALAVTPEVMAPCPILDEVASSLRPQADAKRVTLALELDPETRLVADPRRVRQIAWHLMTNALKFTPPDGRVDVTMRRIGGRGVLEVRDTGCGIRPESLASVFDAFSREDFSSRREHPGLGIGLALVRHLVERQAGTISAKSAGEGAGSTFTVTLPGA